MSSSPKSKRAGLPRPIDTAKGIDASSPYIKQARQAIIIANVIRKRGQINPIGGRYAFPAHLGAAAYAMGFAKENVRAITVRHAIAMRDHGFDRIFRGLQCGGAYVLLIKHFLQPLRLRLRLSHSN